MRAGIAARLDAIRAHVAARLENGRVRECHGDLHARNIVRIDGRLVAFDCMEFEPAFRWIDTAEEAAFLLADLDARGYPLHAHAFLTGFLAQSGDYGACRVLDLYKFHHALVRAKVAALTADNSPQPCALFDSYVAVARRALEPKRHDRIRHWRRVCMRAR